MHDDFEIFFSQVALVATDDPSGEAQIQIVGDGPEGGRNGIPTDGQLLPPGVFAVPKVAAPDASGNADPASTTPALCVRFGGQLFTLPISSPSELLLVPNLLPGDRGIVGSAGAFVRIRDSGKIALSTTDNGKTNGNSVFLEVAPDGFRVVTPWGRIILDQWGFRVVLPSGGEINLMTFNGGPVKSAFIASADSVELDAQNVSLGPGPTDNAVKLNPILAIIAALQKPAAVGVPPLDPATALLLIAQLEQSGVAL